MNKTEIKAFTYHQVIIYYCETIFEVLDYLEELNQHLLINNDYNNAVYPENSNDNALKKSRCLEGNDRTEIKQIRFNNLVIDLTIILEQLKPNISTIILSLIYIDRLLKIFPDIIISKEGSIRNVILISLNMALKYNEDVIFSDRKFTFVTKIDLKDFIKMEQLFCYLLDFRFFVDYETFHFYFKNFKLGMIKMKEDVLINHV